MSLWGPAAEAEIEYRQGELRKAWGSHGAGRAAGRESRAERAERAERRAARRTERSERSRRPDRTEQIREGIAGMRPPSAARHGLFA